MKVKRLKNGTVLVKISKDDKRKIFQTDVENPAGEIVSIIKGVEATDETDEYFSQAVYIGEVMAVASDVKHIQVNDFVVLDYLADSDEDKVAYYDDGDKVIALDAEIKYHTEDKIAFASMRTRMDTYTWRKGDVDSLSWIYAIFRNGILRPNNGYILVEHRNRTWTGDRKSGLTYYEIESDVVVRKVIGIPEDSPVEMGDIISVEAYALLDRSINNHNFDIIMCIDILGTINTKPV